MFINVKCDVRALTSSVTIKIGAYRVLVGKLERKRPVGRQCVDGKLKLKWILKKSDGGVGSGKDCSCLE
jgi:urocanate hydratase